MMQAFRNSAKPLVLIVTVAFLAWLVLDLSGLSSGGANMFSTSTVGKVNGQGVDVRAFQEAVSRLTEQRQRQSSEPLGLAETAQIRDQAWEQFIQERLLAQEYKRWGISVSSQEIAEAIRSTPPQDFMSLPDFQTEGQFDRSKYERWLSSAVGQSYIPVLEAEYRSQLMQSKLARHLVAPLYVPETELWERYRDEHEEVTVGAVTVPPGAISDAAVTVTPSEVDAYYASNRESFRREAMAWLSYLTLDRRPIASDTAAALERAQALRAEILSGTPFDEVARRESADTVSGNRGGDLGEWTRGAFDPAFEAAAFSIPLNRVSEPVLSQFGYHLIEVTARAGNTATARHILVPVEVTGDHLVELDSRADSLETLAADRLDPAALDTAARVLGLPVLKAGPVVKGSLTGAVLDAVIWAFQAEVGEHSPVIETPSAYFVFRVDSARQEGIPPLAQIRGEVEERLRSDKKKAEARRLAQEILREAAAGKSLAAAAADLGLSHQVLGPFSRVNAPPLGESVVGAAFAVRPGQRVGPIDGAAGWVVLEVIRHVPADSAAFRAELPSLREQALDNYRRRYLQQYFSALRAAAKVVDNRHLVFRTSAQIEADAQGATLP